MLPTFDELFARLQASDETADIEAKRSEQISESGMKTVCAFANEPGLGGGYLLLGVSRVKVDPPEYEVTGVPNPDNLQLQVANQCNGKFNVTIRPEFSVHVRPDKKRVVVVHVPECQPHEKPVYVKSMGLPKGAFRRIGSADH